MLRWGQAAMQVLGPMNQRTTENFPIAGELYGWCAGVTAEDLAPGSVGRGIFDAEARGDIPEGTAGHIIHQYLGAGVDTTVAAIGNIVALFGAHPEQFELVRKDPSLVPAAFAEVLRFWVPIHAWGRKITRDVEIDGTLVPAGAQMAILLGVGNHDERHYETRTIPGRAEPGRPPLLRVRTARLRGAGARPHGGPRDHRGAREARAVLPPRGRGARAEQHHAKHRGAGRRRGRAGLRTSWRATHENRTGPPPVRGPRPV